jgi:tRNA(Ile2) C34 agmatinyltransferase TiaS
MTAALLDRPAICRHEPSVGPGVTLQDLLTNALEEVRNEGSTECPVCHARMTSTRAGAECAGCGAQLS